MAIQVGAEAPDFELASSEPTDKAPSGKKIKLSDYRGKKNVVLAFYPLDFSGVCSGEMACFVTDLPDFEGADTQVLGVSVDSHHSHREFKKSLGMKYPLLADFHPKGATAEKYGLYKADLGFTARATVVVDKNGKVAWVHEEELGKPRDNKAILEALKKLG
jgi:peroxiredoxin